MWILVSRPVFEGPGKGWLLAFLVASLGTLAFGGTIVWLLAYGVGAWGVNSSVVWGSARRELRLVDRYR